MTTLDLVKFRTIQQSLSTIEDYNTRRVLKEIIDGVLQLQKHVFRARTAENDNLPADNQLSEQIDGVYLRLVSKGFADLVHYRRHGLGRVPQGCVFIRQRTAYNECLIEGDTALGIDKATDKTVSFTIGDPVGSVVVGLLL